MKNGFRTTLPTAHKEQCHGTIPESKRVHKIQDEQKHLSHRAVLGHVPSHQYCREAANGCETCWTPRNKRSTGLSSFPFQHFLSVLEQLDSSIRQICCCLEEVERNVNVCIAPDSGNCYIWHLEGGRIQPRQDLL